MDNKGAVIRLQMDETLAGLTGKLGELEHQVSATVRTVKESVHSVRDTFDLKLQVRQRPWTLMAGAVVLGFLGGHRSTSHGVGYPTRNGRSAGVPLPRAAAPERPYPEANHDGTSGADTARRSATPTPSWLVNLGESFQPEISQLKGIVVGALLEFVRGAITKPVCRPVEPSVGEANNGSNGKFGESVRPGSPRSDAADV